MDSTERERILGQLRHKLTTLTPSPLSGNHLSERTVTRVENREGLDKTLKYVPVLTDKAIPPSLGLKVPPRKELDYTAAAYYQLGERLAPFYAHFADWILYKGANAINDEEFTNPALVFSGRDSLGFLYAFSQRSDIPFVYSPGNRGAFRDQRWSSSRRKWRHESEQAANFYERNRLVGRDLLLVDFGVGGTIFRREILSTIQHRLPRGKARILLAIFLGWKDVTVNEQGKFIFDPSRRDEIEQADQELKYGIEAYFMEFPREKAHLPPPLDDPRRRQQLSFIRTFQELPSYIKEAPPETYTLAPKRQTKISLAIDSLYGLVAKYAFFRGLMGSNIANISTNPQEVAEILNKFYKHTRRYPRTFGLLTDLGDRANAEPEVNAAIKKANRALKRKGLKIAY